MSESGAGEKEEENNSYFKLACSCGGLRGSLSFLGGLFCTLFVLLSAWLDVHRSKYLFLVWFSISLFIWTLLFKAEIDSNISICYRQTIDSQIIHYQLPNINKHLIFPVFAGPHLEERPPT